MERVQRACLAVGSFYLAAVEDKGSSVGIASHQQVILRCVPVDTVEIDSAPLGRLLDRRGLGARVPEEEHLVVTDGAELGGRVRLEAHVLNRLRVPLEPLEHSHFGRSWPAPYVGFDVPQQDHAVLVSAQHPGLLRARVEGKVGLAGFRFVSHECGGGALVLRVSGRGVGDVEKVESGEVGLGNEDVFVLRDGVDFVDLGLLWRIDPEKCRNEDARQIFVPFIHLGRV
mmetsp:Transcript_28257/g.67215  ORF Transcript_28257/g.67215 Transcript_28257/m.67215 type:complete len:228 (-) Transcript_28257:377-1060(-)